MPCYAECGGLMYLAEQLKWQDKTAPMVGIIPANAVMHSKPQGRGYVKVKQTSTMPWDELQDDTGNATTAATINAHEFHYSQLEGLQPSDEFAYDVVRGYGIDGKHDGWMYKNLLASYVHMRDTSQYHWARRFVNFVRKVADSNAAPSQ